MIIKILSRTLNIKFKKIINKKYMSNIKTEEFDEKLEEAKTQKVMTAKQIKKKFRPEFQKNFEKYYPVNFFKKINFVRNKCEECSNFFWNINPARKICGDSNCVGTYTFINKPSYLKKEDNSKFSLGDAWKTFEDSFTNARIPCTKIDRYPVVARWRNDVDYVQAGIYCFQPYCVTGEMAPPANPLICPQFCVRFNDLDNIGLTGRHYSGFVMIGIQVFNYPGEYKFFKEECVEFNYNWLTQGLKIPVEEICFSEDIWAGGGNMGPCVEYFVHGMEVGNMVFMQYKTFHDGSLEELKTKVIDTGIGLERVAWLLNGDSTSYLSTFKHGVEFLTKKLNVELDNEIWSKLGPYSTMLDVDECEDLDGTWQKISDLIKMEKKDIVKAIEPMRDIFIILDHTRSAFFLIRDGSLPSNVGGGFNLRNILRRTFAIMSKNKWWDILGFEGYMEIFEYQKKDIQSLYGDFEKYTSFRDIIELEFNRWKSTDTLQQKKLKKLLKKKKGKLVLDDWFTAVTAWGIPPDTIFELSKIPIPDNLYLYIDEQRQKVGKAPEQVLYDTSHLKDTVCLYYDHLKSQNPLKNDFEFSGKIISIFSNLLQDQKRNIVILDQTCFYPTSGGQSNDMGQLIIGEKTYNVVNVEKVGGCILHILDSEISDDLLNSTVKGIIDEKRRIQLRSHHTSAHIIFAAAREVLGPHVWQQGAKKTIKQAHLDITHYTSLSNDQELLIQEAANRIVMKSVKINKTLEKKSDAEKEHGFRLYQGGVVPGNELRVVHIEGVDVEACCGTHCDNTSEVGWIKVLTTKRIADGIVRIYFVAGERTLGKLRAETEILNDLTDMWSIPQDQIMITANRIFKDYKKYKFDMTEAKRKILNLQVSNVLNGQCNGVVIKSDEENPTLYFSNLGLYAKKLFDNKKNIVFISDTFIFGFFSQKDFVSGKDIEEYFGEKANIKTSYGKKKQAIKNCQVVTLNSKKNLKDPVAFFEKLGLKVLDI